MKRLLSIIVSICIVSLLLPMSAQATNGYFLIGYGAKSRGMGGVGVAYPQGFMAAAANPAAIGSVGTGLEVGIELFNPPRCVGGGGVDPAFPTEFQFEADSCSGANEFLIPSFGGVYKFNRKMSLGMTAIGNGSNTRYSALNNFFSLTGVPAGEVSWGTLGVNLIQMQMLFPVSYRVNKQHSIGVAPVFAIQTFRAYGLGNFGGIFNFSSDIDHLTNNGNDWSYGTGMRIGWLGNFFKGRLKLGANYASRTYMTKFDKYSGLFAEQGSFDIPEHYTLGISVEVTPKLRVAFDVQQIMFSNVASIGNEHVTSSLNDLCSRPIGVDPSQCTTGISPTPASRALGEDDGFGFGWDDATAYKLGIEYQYSEKLTLRTGWNYGKSVVPDTQLMFNMIAPAVLEHHITAGLSYRFAKNHEINASYVHGFKRSQVCAVNDGCTTLLTQQPGTFVAADLELNALGVSYAFNF